MESAVHVHPATEIPSAAVDVRQSKGTDFSPNVATDKSSADTVTSCEQPKLKLFTSLSRSTRTTGWSFAAIETTGSGGAVF
jgi:hypothetical protein